MADKVKVLVVGLGNMGASHASAYHRNPGFEIVGLMSRSIKSKPIPNELAGYPLFEDYDEALRVTVVSGKAGDLHHHLFTRPDGDRVLIVWDKSAAPLLAIDVPGISGSVEYDLDGRPLDWEPDASVLGGVQLAPGVPRIFKLMR